MKMRLASAAIAVAASALLSSAARAQVVGPPQVIPAQVIPAQVVVPVQTRETPRGARAGGGLSSDFGGGRTGAVQPAVPPQLGGARSGARAGGRLSTDFGGGQLRGGAAVRSIFSSRIPEIDGAGTDTVPGSPPVVNTPTAASQVPVVQQVPVDRGANDPAALEAAVTDAAIAEGVVTDGVIAEESEGVVTEEFAPGDVAPASSAEADLDRSHWSRVVSDRYAVRGAAGARSGARRGVLQLTPSAVGTTSGRTRADSAVRYVFELTPR